MIEKVHSLNFNMVYVGETQKDVEDFHGHSLANADDVKRILQVMRRSLIDSPPFYLLPKR